MVKTADSDQYLKAMLGALRPGASDILAFYEHRVGVIGTDPGLMLMPWDDHLVHRGDGVFETVKYIGRRIYQLDAHLKRMDRSAAAIHLAPPCAWEEVRGIVVEVARAGGADQGLIRILLGRGPGGFGIDPNDCPVSSLYVAAYNIHPKPEAVFQKGVTAFKTSIPAKQPYLATIKSVDYLPNVLMKREAVGKGFDYPLCFNEHGFLAEGATENVCLVNRRGALHIPEFTNALAGTTLMRAVDLIKGELEIIFRPIREDEILEAREVIIVGTTVDAVSVVRYEGKPIFDVRPGPVSRRLRELLMNDLRENGLEF
ncbi:MAG: aminotransferase class IV [Desulfovibrionaceae bacterium]|nr:aminotransferase class IV [Desulfovibrionaceae bacterium]